MTKILLVEDDINLREIYAARLSAEGYELAVASDGEEALTKATAERPDLILLDVMMPKISGFDVLDIVRSTDETKNAKVIMLSALSQETDKERGESLGADKYLIKSQITLEDVVETVKELLEGGSDNTPIVTTSEGRLPENGAQNPEETPAPESGINQTSPSQVQPPNAVAPDSATDVNSVNEQLANNLESNPGSSNPDQQPPHI